jgi:uncharacterized protein YbjT (DUF2867 family)
MNTLVIGCTGMVGSWVVQGLMNKGVSARCLSRSRDKITNLPKGLEGFVADMDRPETLPAAFAGMDTVFLLVPVGPGETDRGLAAVEAAKAAYAKKIVYLSTYMPEGSDAVPHFNSKIPIENAVKASGIPYTILRPNNFFQNDLTVLGVIMTYGIYPTPVGAVGLNRIDVRDAADAAVNALTQSGYEGQTYSLHGGETLNGRDMARIYSRYIGRDVRYAGNDLDAWEQHVRNVMPEWMRRDFRVMYRYFQDHGMIAPDGDLEKQQVLLGRQPRAFDDFVRDVANEWKRSLACAA